MGKNMPTMKDVAREAGVALGTVSRVFNGQAVGDDYRIRVEEAARRLGYQVNPLARGLKTNKTNIVAVMLPEMNHPYYAALAEELTSALAKRDCHTMLFLSGHSYEHEQDCIRMVRQNKVDGIIGLTYNKVELNGDIPFISIDRHFSADIPCVASDNYGGGRIAAEVLISRGCKKMLCIRTGSNLPGETDKRCDGFMTGCNLLNVPCDILRLNYSPEDDMFREYFLPHIIDGKLEYDGIFCSTDYLLLQISRVLESYGIQVPQDVQMIGFDGIRRFDTGEYYCSTVVQPVRAIAETCVDILLKEDRDTIPSLVCLPVSYVDGCTTKAQEDHN